MIATDKKYLMIYPNNDLGSSIILDAYQTLKENPNFRILPSVRFEYFLTLLKNADFIIGNSSAGVREAPYYGVPTINIGTRQQNRINLMDIQNIDCKAEQIVGAIADMKEKNITESVQAFGNGNSAALFLKSLENKAIWNINHQKQFRDI